jgi:hypothetical protein
VSDVPGAVFWSAGKWGRAGRRDRRDRLDCRRFDRQGHQTDDDTEAVNSAGSSCHDGRHGYAGQSADDALHQRDLVPGGGAQSQEQRTTVRRRATEVQRLGQPRLSADRPTATPPTGRPRVRRGLPSQFQPRRDPAGGVTGPCVGAGPSMRSSASHSTPIPLMRLHGAPNVGRRPVVGRHRDGTSGRIGGGSFCPSGAVRRCRLGSLVADSARDVDAQRAGSTSLANTLMNGHHR